MFQSPRSRKIGAVAASAVSWFALYWVFSQLPGKGDVWFKVGLAAALLTVTAAFVFSFGLCLSYVGRRRHWSAQTCHKAGIWILLPGALLCLLVLPESWTALWIVNLPLFTGYVCRKLVHPELSEDEAYAPEPPLTLFPR